MLFHQIQLMVCAVLAKRYANAGAASQTPGGEVARAMQ
jgi:predicted Na+-dependent transporter